jgi:hypothetical protein
MKNILGKKAMAEEGLNEDVGEWPSFFIIKHCHCRVLG